MAFKAMSQGYMYVIFDGGSAYISIYAQKINVEVSDLCAPQWTTPTFVHKYTIVHHHLCRMLKFPR
jgi:hypothetical protein